MTKTSVVPALTIEARLKRRLRRHFNDLGFQKDADGNLALADQEKSTVRTLHRHQRSDLLKLHKSFIKESSSTFQKYFAEGTQVDPNRIQLLLQKVDANTIESRLFRFASLTWSIPVSNGFGRRLRYLVWDEQNGKLVGLIALGDPVFNLSVRDKLIGWDAQARGLRLANVLDAYVLGAVPPYNLLLGGKAVSCLIRTQEIYGHLEEYSVLTDIGCSRVRFSLARHIPGVSAAVSGFLLRRRAD